MMEQARQQAEKGNYAEGQKLMENVIVDIKNAKPEIQMKL